MTDGEQLARLELLESKITILEDRVNTATLRALNSLLALLVFIETIQLSVCLYIIYGTGILRDFVERADVELPRVVDSFLKYWSLYAAIALALSVVLAGLTYVSNCKAINIRWMADINFVVLLAMKVLLSLSLIGLYFMVSPFIESM